MVMVVVLLGVRGEVYKLWDGVGLNAVGWGLGQEF